MSRATSSRVLLGGAVLLVVVGLPACRIFGEGIPCEASADCPERYPVCTVAGAVERRCVPVGAGVPVEELPHDGGPVPHDDAGANDDAGGNDDGGVQDDAGAPVDGGSDGGADDGGLPVDPCESATVPVIAIAPELVCGGAALEIAGSGFDASTAVLVDGEAASVLYVDEEGTSITAYLERAAPSGTVELVVDNAGCRASTTVSLGTAEPGLVWPTVHFLEPASILRVGFVSPVSQAHAALYAGGERVELPLVFTETSSAWFEVPVATLEPETRYTVVAALDPAACPITQLDRVERSASVVTGSLNGLRSSEVDQPLRFSVPLATPLDPETAVRHEPHFVFVDDAGALLPYPALYATPGELVPPRMRRGLELPVGHFTLYAVDAAGTVVRSGDLRVTITSLPTPRIERVAGAVPVAGVNGELRVIGVDLTGPGGEPPLTELLCHDGSGGLSTLSLTVVSGADNELVLEVPAPDETYKTCLLHLVRDDGAETVSAHLATGTGPPGPLVAHMPLGVPRADLALAAREHDELSASLYAIGGTGENGSSAVVERADVKPLGLILDWRGDRSLPMPRSEASAVVVDRYLYLLGGAVQGVPVTSVLRARILDERDAPVAAVEEVVIDAGAELGLAPGLYYYAVTGVRDENDPIDPGGETPAVHVASILVGQGSTGGRAVRVRWDATASHVAYRVYRSTVPNAPASELARLAEVPAGTSELLDDNSVLSGEAPPVVGSLGTWQEVVTLSGAHVDGAAVTLPGTQPELHTIAVIGGASPTGVPTAQVELIDVQVTPNSTQLVTARSGPPLSQARHSHGATVAIVDVYADTTGPTPVPFVFVGPGIGSDTFEMATLSQGSLTGWSTSVVPYEASDYGLANENGSLLLFGVDGSIYAASEVCGNAVFGVCPELSPPSPMPYVGTAPRSDPAATTVLGQTFIVGGVNGGPIGAVESTSP